MNTDRLAEALTLVARSLDKLEASVGELKLNQGEVAARLTKLDLTVGELQDVVKSKDAKAETWQRKAAAQIEALQKRVSAIPSAQ